jgi:CO/xanthine dehydrogenase Mo-binding subunit
VPQSWQAVGQLVFPQPDGAIRAAGGRRDNGEPMSIMGTRVLRTEDPRLITQGGVYTDDLRLPELTRAAYVTFVRSPIAHALITGIDTSAATEFPGVVAVLTSCSRPTGCATSASRWPLS